MAKKEPQEVEVKFEPKTNPELNSKGVYVAILNQGNVRVELAGLATEMTHQRKYRLHLSYPSAKPISNNRNEIVQDFLSKPEYDYLMMIDSDIIPPLNILDLVDHQKPIMGCVCFAYMDDGIIPLILKEIPEEERKDPRKPYKVMDLEGDEGVAEVDAIGTGLIVIRRDVLEALENEQPFCNRYDEKGLKTLGLDLSFCQKAKAKGFQIFAHLDYICSHWVKINLKDVYQAVSTANEIKLQKIKQGKDVTERVHK
mgnify:CR=1 FL=1|tara:strand:- start:8008 stop:8772 length:765 start_codon:yes stop_codon:yes gene_type:complete